MPIHQPNGALYLIPSSIGESDLGDVWPSNHLQRIDPIRVFIVENLRTARRFLRTAGYAHPFDEVTFHLLNKHTSDVEQEGFLQAALKGEPIGLLSEAGCPCIADPGQKVVYQAHMLGIPVKPMVGPSSILLALMASGMNGQHFQFHGYLPIQQPQRSKAIRSLEMASEKGGTQIFMETPFRNQSLVSDLLSTCKADTLLCMALDIAHPTEWIKTMTIGEWKNATMPGLHKRPGIFLLDRLG